MLVNRSSSAWVTMPVGIAVAILVALTVSWKAGLAVFALALILTFVQVASLVRRGFVGLGRVAEYLGSANYPRH